MPKILHRGVHSLVGRVGRRRGQGTRGDKRPSLRDCVRGGPRSCGKRVGTSSPGLEVTEGFRWGVDL